MRTLPKLIYFCTINRNSNSRQSCHRTPGQEIHCANAMSSRVLSPYSVSSHLALVVCAICPIIGIIPKGGILGELQLWQCIVAVHYGSCGSVCNGSIILGEIWYWASILLLLLSMSLFGPVFLFKIFLFFIPLFRPENTNKTTEYLRPGIKIATLRLKHIV